VFYNEFGESGLCVGGDLKQVFLNLLDLIKTSKSFLATLIELGEDRVGKAVLDSMPHFETFLVFCRDQKVST